MKKRLFAPVIGIILMALTLGFIDLPLETKAKILPSVPAWMQEMKVHLGLDLQGGSQLDYKIDLRKVPAEDQKDIIDGVKEVINRRVNGLGVSEPNIYTSEIADEKHIIVELAGIKDINEAKKIVGKTIQLEFKEQRDNLDPQEEEKIKTQAEELLHKIKDNQKENSFNLLGLEEEQSFPGKAFLIAKNEFFFKDELASEFQDKIETLKKGETFNQVIFRDPEYDYYSFNNSLGTADLMRFHGYFLLKLGDKKEVEREIKEVKASHIVIGYKNENEEKSSIGDHVTRTKEEAEKLAKEILEKVKTDSSNFGELAATYSDELDSKTSKGALPEAVKEGGMYLESFTNATLALEKDGDYTPSLVSTLFGYHIIKADKVNVTKKLEPKYQIHQIFFSAEPDPWKETKLNGEHFKHADVQYDSNSSQISVSINFNEEGSTLFEEITGRNIGRPVAIFVGGSLISSPKVNGKISGGRAIITGDFDYEEASNLARDLNTGAIPAPVILTGQYTIGATLGQDSLNKSLYAGIIGLIILAIYMILYYRIPGVIATIALSIYAIILIFLIKVALPLWIALSLSLILFSIILNKILNSKDSSGEKFVSFILACFILFFFTFLLSTPVVLTLAGIAGVILSIGMAVDANILIFERMKEELQSGRSLMSSIEIGFNRAWDSIRDSNFSSLITCAILLYFGSSIIQGFAFNLATGILVSMFTAITISKTFLKLLVNTPVEKSKILLGNSDKESKKPLKIISNSKIWFGISGTLIGISLIGAAIFGLKLGIDFTGGTLMEVKFEKAVTQEQVKEVLNALNEEKINIIPKIEGVATLSSQTINLGAPSVVTSGENSFLIKIKHISEETHQKILSTLTQKFGKVEEPRFTIVGPTIGETLKKKALMALLVAGFMIVIYIGFAFRRIPKHINPWRFGFCAIFALLHDVIITLGVFVFLGQYIGLEIDALFITALLTIMGFSVHDTIVVFDRIRENIKYQERGETFEDVVDKSLTQTMARSINTSISTLVTLVALFIFGGESIKYFVLALIIGTIVGTYSSIFTASPILVAWKKAKESK